jgi:hypothetical protein
MRLRRRSGYAEDTYSDGRDVMRQPWTADEDGRLDQPSDSGWSGKGSCEHRRMVDDERSKSGKKTGRLICIECGAIIKRGDE